VVTNNVDEASLKWLGILLKELAERRRRYQRYDDYYSGRQGQRFVATGYRELFTQAFEYYRENVCKVVVQTVEQRLDVDGFRFPSIEASADATDEKAWQIWQDNGLDSRMQTGLAEAIVQGLVYVLVSPFDSERVGPGKRSPLITIEMPSESIVATSPGGLTRLVGVKTWYDATAERSFATLYYPDRIEKFQSTQRVWANQHGRGAIELGGWERRTVPDEPWPLPHRLGAVPLVPVVNTPRLGSGMWAGIAGESDIEDVIPIQDAINFIALNGLVASDKAAFPQKWATGVEIPTVVGTDGKARPAAEWNPDIDSILSTRSSDAKFGNFDAAELSQYDDKIKGKLEEIALIAQIPISNFIAQTGQPASGDAREAADVGLTKKSERKQRHFGEALEEVMRLSFRQLGDDTRADDTACETEWRPAGVEPTAGKIDALTKERNALKVPLAVLWKRAGYSATERAKFRPMIEAERNWLNSTPVQTTQPTAEPGPDPTPVQDTSTTATPPAGPTPPAPTAKPAALANPAPARK
jgi:hypothetical protein